MERSKFHGMFVVHTYRFAKRVVYALVSMRMKIPVQANGLGSNGKFTPVDGIISGRSSMSGGNIPLVVVLYGWLQRETKDSKRKMQTKKRRQCKKKKVRWWYSNMIQWQKTETQIRLQSTCRRIFLHGCAVSSWEIFCGMWKSRLK